MHVRIRSSGLESISLMHFGFSSLGLQRSSFDEIYKMHVRYLPLRLSGLNLWSYAAYMVFHGNVKLSTSGSISVCHALESSDITWWGDVSENFMQIEGASM